MAMKKDEMENHQRQYQSLMADARAAEEAGLREIKVSGTFSPLNRFVSLP